MLFFNYDFGLLINFEFSDTSTLGDGYINSALYI